MHPPTPTPGPWRRTAACTLHVAALPLLIGLRIALLPNTVVVSLSKLFGGSAGSCAGIATTLKSQFTSCHNLFANSSCACANIETNQYLFDKTGDWLIEAPNRRFDALRSSRVSQNYRGADSKMSSGPGRDSYGFILRMAST